MSIPSTGAQRKPAATASSSQVSPFLLDMRSKSSSRDSLSPLGLSLFWSCFCLGWDVDGWSFDFGKSVGRRFG